MPNKYFEGKNYKQSIIFSVLFNIKFYLFFLKVNDTKGSLVFLYFITFFTKKKTQILLNLIVLKDSTLCLKGLPYVFISLYLNFTTNSERDFNRPKTLNLIK